MLSPRDLILPPNIRREEYQFSALESVVKQWEAGNIATMLVAPTGVGKTVISCMISKYAIEELDRSVLFVAHRSELIDQAESAYSKAFGFTTAIERAGESEYQYRNNHDGQRPEVVVATIQSLYQERIMERFPKDRFGLIVCDECHHSCSDSHKSMLDYFQNYLLLGLTATPDGATKNLSTVYQSIAYQLRLRQAIADGFLVPIVVRTIPVPVNLKKIRTTGGDYNAGDLAERLSPAIEKMCFNVHNQIGDRKTVMFCPDVGSSMMIAQMLSKMGRPAEYVTCEAGKYGMKKKDRKEALARFKSGEFKVITCADLLSEGFDHPEISCVVIASPTRKRYKYYQRAGRATRLCPEIGKVNALIIDLDWQQDESSRELCRAHTLFAEPGTNPEALEILEGRLRERKAQNGQQDHDIDVLKTLGEIESDLHHARLIKVHYTGKHTELYQSYDNTPFGVGKILGIKMGRQIDFNMGGGGRASEWQVKKLESLGIKGAERLNLWAASRLISKLVSDDKKGLASWQYKQAMLKAGVNEEQARSATKKEAASIVAEITLKQKEMCPRL